jgi:hypothetical protein
MSKFNVNRKDLYKFNDNPVHQKRTKDRLQRILDAGMEECGVAQFGIPGVMSGLYIEKVWNDSDKKFNEYMEWAINLKDEKNKTL